MPDNVPAVTWRVAATDPNAREGTAIVRQVEGQIGPDTAGPRINMTVVTPATSRGRVPMILIVNFGGGTAQLDLDQVRIDWAC
mgnify:CR=1 FL=1